MWLLYILSLVPLTLGSSITNGTCYYKAGEEADSVYSPCGNTIDGQWPCCQLGDKCNNYNTCTWDSGDGVYYTYFAGCTDPDYEDDSCPDKGNFSDYQWVGLAWAGCTPKNGIVSWVGCNNDGYPAVRESDKSKHCTCDDNGTPLLQAPTGLVAEGYLPTSKMGEISWEPGWSRTDPVVPSTASDSGSSVSTRTLAPATTRASFITSSSSSVDGDATTSDNLNNSADTATASLSPAQPTSTVDTEQGQTQSSNKTGIIAVSSTLSVCAVIGVGLFVWFARRHARKQQEKKQEALAFDNNPQDQEKNSPTIPSIPATVDVESTQHNSTITSQHSELPGTPADPSFMSTVSPTTREPTPKTEYDVYYRPYQYRNPAAEISLASGSPETTRSEGWQQDYQPYRPPTRLGTAQTYYVTGVPARNNQDEGAHELPGCMPGEPTYHEADSQGREHDISRHAGE